MVRRIRRLPRGHEQHESDLVPEPPAEHPLQGRRQARLRPHDQRDGRDRPCDDRDHGEFSAGGRNRHRAGSAPADLRLRPH